MTRRTSFAAAALAAALLVTAACGQRSEDTTAHAQQTGDSTSADSTAADINGTAYDATAQGTAANPEGNGRSVPPDNTGINERDRNTTTPTADRQSQSAADLELTRRIRQAITSDDTISANGKNVKIVTRDGAVTLRGPVKDEAERKLIADKAQEIAGTGKVENYLEVTR
jgi:hyperosmotically inducible protein